MQYIKQWLLVGCSKHSFPPIGLLDLFLRCFNFSIYIVESIQELGKDCERISEFHKNSYCCSTPLLSSYCHQIYSSVVGTIKYRPKHFKIMLHKKRPRFLEVFFWNYWIKCILVSTLSVKPLLHTYLSYAIYSRCVACVRGM